MTKEDREAMIRRLESLYKEAVDNSDKEALFYAIEALQENESLARSVNEASELLRKKRPHGTCKTCKHYTPYREQFSYGYRGDGYCKSTITTSEGNAYINCHDEWYCANYEKAGE